MYVRRTSEISTPEAIIFPCICFILCIFICCIRNRETYLAWKRRRRSGNRGPVTSSPTVPIWLQHQQAAGRISRSLLSEVLIQHHSYPNTANANSAIQWVQSQITDKYGNLNRPGANTVFEMPNDSCTVSVPMKGFKCAGGSCTDFRPSEVASESGYYSYQMIGDQKIQLVHYIHNNIAYPAGIVIYIEYPYLESLHFNEQAVYWFTSGPKFHKEPQGSNLELALQQRQNFENLTKILKSEYCKSLRRQVLIGVDSGETWHFEAVPGKRLYRISKCPSCKIEEEVDDNQPPAYETMFP